MSAVNIEISPVKLRQARGQRSREEVAKAVGSSRQHLWMIETGECTPNSDLLARLCVLYGVNITDLIRNSNGKKKAA